MMHNVFTGGIVTASIKPIATPLTLILRQSLAPHVLPLGSELILRFSIAPYTPPTSE